MPGKKPKPANDGGPVLVILEEIRSQNRAILEAVERYYLEIRHELTDLRREVQAETGMLRSAVQLIGADVQQLEADVK